MALISRLSIKDGRDDDIWAILSPNPGVLAPQKSSQSMNAAFRRSPEAFDAAKNKKNKEEESTGMLENYIQEQERRIAIQARATDGNGYE